MATILIVDDDVEMQASISQILKDSGYKTIVASEGNRALREVKSKSADLVLLDIQMPGMDGMVILQEMLAINKDLAIIMVTGYSSVKGAVLAMKLGASDYITKPFLIDELLFVINRTLQNQYLNKEVKFLRKKLSEQEPLETVMGESTQIKQVLKKVNLIAPTNMTVIIQGESGTGKERIAELIHKKSLRKDMPFVTIDCGAIAESLAESEFFGTEKGAYTGADKVREGKFEQADGGTLFLDEIGNLSISIQTMLLRVLQEKKLQHLGGKKDIKIELRIIAATNTDLAEAVRAGKFRNDLFHRLNEFRIDMPRLSDRQEDIPFLANYFMEEANIDLNKKILNIANDAMLSLLHKSWLGNVRELRNFIRRAVLLSESDVLELKDFAAGNPELPQSIFDAAASLEAGLSYDEILQNFEKELIRLGLKKVGGNKVKAAELLMMNKKTLYRKLNKLP